MSQVALPDDSRNYVMISQDSIDDSLANLDTGAIQTLYKKYGAILFRGFEFDADIFISMTESFSDKSVKNESPNRKSLAYNKSIQTVNLGDAEFALHPELARTPYKPDICFFGCINPPSIGGETTLCDGVEIVKNLPDELVDRLRKRQMLYIQNAVEDDYVTWFNTRSPDDDSLRSPNEHCPFSFYREDGQIKRSFMAPALHKPMFSDELAFGSFLLFARYTRNDRNFPLFEDGSEIPDEIASAIKNASEPLTCAINWQKDDVIMIDNTRFLHGRNKIHDANERLILTYFGYINFSDLDEHVLARSPWRF